ncbi:MAG: translation elongation factor Ts, partial [Patescibacteria group bacterium]
VSISAVKQALEEAAGNEEKAIEILRKRGEAQAVKKSAREQREGAVAIEKSGNKAAIVQLACETDFVARGDDFRNCLQHLAKTALAKGPDAARQEATSILPALVQKLGENIAVADANVVTGGTLGAYVHSNAKIGVIVALDPSTSSGQAGKWEDIAKDVAMHAAAMAPQFVSPEEVSAEAVEKEKEIWREQLKKEGKPEAIWDKIMMGKEKKFREAHALLTQPFAKDPSKKVEQILSGAKVISYVRLSVGE